MTPRRTWNVERGACWKGLWLSTFYLLLSTNILHAENPLLRKAEAAWQDREQPGKTEESIALWEEALKAQPTRADIQISLMKALGRAVRHSKTIDERRRWSERARAVAEQAVAANPANANVYAYYGEALGQWAEARKGLRSLRLIRKAVEALEKAVSLDPHNPYAHMLLAEFYRRSPRFISIGDKQKALKHARLSVCCGDAYAINHLVLARAYLDVGEKEEAIEELQKIMNLSPPKDAIPETRADQETARELLRSLGVIPAAKIDPPPELPDSQCGTGQGYCSEP